MTPASVIGPSTFSNIFSPETTEPTEFQFHRLSKTSEDGETKVCSNGPGHMTKMATTAIHGKTLKIFTKAGRLVTLGLSM